MGLTDTAYHEAGHAVADFVFGVTIIRVSIVPDEGSLGHVRHKPPFQRDDVTEAELAPRTLRRLENRIVGVFAGEVALAKSRRREPNLSAAGNLSDIRQIGSLGHLGRGLYDMHPDEQTAYLDLLLVRARLLVDDYWFLIAPLAAEMLATRTLSGYRVNRLLRSVVQTKVERLMPEAFVPSKVVVGGRETTLPPTIEPASMTAYGWRLLAEQVAVLSRPRSDPRHQRHVERPRSRTKQTPRSN